MSTNNPTSKEVAQLQQQIQLHAGVTASLEPDTLSSVKIGLSIKQNFAMAAEEIFNHALKRTVWNYRANYTAVDVFLKEIKDTATESIATQKGIERMSNMVFGPSGGALREFLNLLSVQFFSQFVEFHQMWDELMGDIARALTTGYTSGEVDESMCLVPEEIRARTYSTGEMKKLLMANTWLIMFILILLWGKILTYDELRSNYRRSLAATAIG